MRWLLYSYSVPSEPSRHRVSVWRELRRVGAVPVQQAVWALPEEPRSLLSLNRVRTLVEGAGGDDILVRADPVDRRSAERIERAYADAREAEYAELLAECDKFEEEIAGEVAKRKLTAAELDEEEHNLDRLVRWHSDLQSKAVLPTPSAERARRRVEACEARLAGFADLVFQEQLP